MIKSVKRLGAAVLSAVMMLTAVATPLGDNLPAVMESTSLTASAAEISTDGYYTLKNLYAGKMLNVRGSYSTSNTNVTVYEADGTTGQEFRFIKSGSNYVLEPKCAPSCALNVYGTSASNGSNVNIWTKSGNSTQAWVMEYNSSSSAYVIRCAANTNLVLTATGTSNSSNVALANYSSGNKSQLWSAAKVGGSTPTPSGAITTQNIQAVLDKYNYKTGKYWTPINAGDSRTSGYMGSDRPSSTSYYYDKGSQCWGFANFVLHEVTGTASNPNNGNNSNWEKLSPSQVSSLKVGDHVRIKYWSTKNNAWSWHSGVVLTANGDNYTFAECWGGVNNKIVIGGKLNASYGTMSSIKSVLEFVYRYKGSHTHSYGSWYTKTSATCTSGGTEERKCSCGATESRSTSALGHNYGSWSTVTNATCTSGGSEKRTCSRCSNSETRSTSATGHSYGYWKTDKEATCTEEGTEVRICSKCNTAEYRTVSALGHDFSAEWTTDEEPSCTTEGKKSRHCTRCDAVTDETIIEKSEHTYITSVIAPSVWSRGYTLHTCVYCGYSFEDNYTEPLDIKDVTGFKVKTQGTNSLTLVWDKAEYGISYSIEQYKGGKWEEIEVINNYSVTSLNVNGLKADTTYTFRIRPFIFGDCEILYGNYTRLAAKTRIENVGLFEGSAVSESAVKLDWNKNDKATGYVIEQYRGGKWTAIATAKNNTTLTFTVKGLAVGSVYKFRMKSYRTVDSKTEFSEYKTITVATLLGSVPDFKVTSETGSWITLEWAKNDNATGYSIEQYKGGKWTVIATTKNNTTLKFTVKGLNSDTTYTFRIRAYKGASENTVYSDYVRLAGKTRISNVSSFKGTTVSANSVRLDWSKNDVASGYIIEQLKDGKWVQIVVVKGNENIAYTVNDLEKSTSYQFRIKSYRTVDGKTDFSVYANTTVSTAG